eukprot:RCo008476
MKCAALGVLGLFVVICGTALLVRSPTSSVLLHSWWHLRSDSANTSRPVVELPSFSSPSLEPSPPSSVPSASSPFQPHSEFGGPPAPVTGTANGTAPVVDLFIRSYIR